MGVYDRIADELAEIRKVLTPKAQLYDADVERSRMLAEELRSSLLGVDPERAVTATWKGGEVRILKWRDKAPAGKWVHAIQIDGTSDVKQLDAAGKVTLGKLNQATRLESLELRESKDGLALAVAGPVEVT